MKGFYRFQQTEYHVKLKIFTLPYMHDLNDKIYLYSIIYQRLAKHMIVSTQCIKE